jgi:hypothetical protein
MMSGAFWMRQRRKGVGLVTTATAATTIAHGFTGFSFVDVEFTTHEILAVQGVDGFLASFSSRHFDETETTGTTGFTTVTMRTL